jgi:excisionase family DNA binding protein
VESRVKFGSATTVEALLLHVAEVAIILGMGRSKVYEMVSAGALPVVKIGTAVRVPKKALLEWIEKHTEKAA